MTDPNMLRFQGAVLTGTILSQMVKVLGPPTRGSHDFPVQVFQWDGRIKLRIEFNSMPAFMARPIGPMSPACLADVEEALKNAYRIVFSCEPDVQFVGGETDDRE